jgi:predicted dehydrogenase
MTGIPIAAVGMKFGRQAMRWLRRDDPTSQHLRLVAVCDQDPAAAAAAGAEFGVPHHLHLDAVLADPSIPALACFTPPAGRADLLARAFAAGKDVLTTKPLARTAADAAAIISGAAAAGRIVHLNAPSPDPVDLGVMRTWIERHRLGRVVAAHAEAVCSYQESADGSWYDDPERCPLAPVFRIGIYLINDLVRLCGPVAEVYAQGARLRTGRPTPDQGQLALRFASGALGTITASFACANGDQYRNGLILHCEHGTISRNLDPGLAWTDGPPLGADLALVCGDPNRRAPVERVRVTQMSGDYQWDRFADAIRTRTPLPTDAAQAAVEAIQVVEAMALSERTGMPVRLGA